MGKVLEREAEQVLFLILLICCVISGKMKFCLIFPVCVIVHALHFQGFSGNQTGEPWFELVLFIAGSGCENLRRKWLGLPRCI